MYNLGLLLTIGASCLLFTQASLLTDEELKQLKAAPLIPIKVQDKPLVEGRSIKEIWGSIQKAVKCRGKTCTCCTEFEVSFFTVEACANITIIPEEKAFEVSLMAADKPVFKHRLSVRQLEKVCGNVADIEELEICMYTTLDEDKPNELLSCMGLDLTFSEIVLVNLNFHCLKYADKQLSFVKNEKTNKEEALANLHVKNPLHVIGKIVKKLMSKLEEIPSN